MEARERKICGAKTRAGTPCKRAPRLNGRCNLHGGKSRAGIAHPNYKHGLYSKYSPLPLLLKAARRREKARARAERLLRKMQAERAKRRGK